MADVREKAHKILNSAKTIIRTNKNIRLMFGKKLLAKHGNDASKLTLSTRTSSRKEPNVQAYSMLQTPQSLRADLTIFEDVISHRYKTSIRIKEKTDRNFEAIIPILEKDAKIIYIGTRFHYDDIPAQIKKSNDLTGKWNVIEISAEDENGNATYSKIIDDDELKRLKSSISYSFYSSQYLNKPISKEETLFHPEEYSHYDTIPESSEFRSVIAGVDLAVSTDVNADNRTIVFVGVGKDHRMYLLDAYATKEKLDLFYESIKRYYEKWKPDRIFVEANGPFRAVYDNFVDKSVKDRSYLPFSDVVNTKNKELRIELTLLPLLKNGMLILPDRKAYIDNDSLRTLIDIELAFFNPSIHSNKDDLLDALEIACSKAKDMTSSSKNNFRIGGELRTSSIDMRI